jgi:tetratricopeptide (TPR) repeat protein
MPGAVRRTRVALVIALSLIACERTPSTTAAQGNTRAADYYRQFTQAQDLAKKEKFADAAALYDRLTKAYPEDAEVWIELGKALAKAQQYRAAAESYSRALALGGEYPGMLSYRVARVYALEGDKTQSLAWLAKSLAKPLEFRPEIARDQAFAAWRDDEAFRKLAGIAPKRSLSREQEWNYDLDYFVAEVRRLHFAYRDHPLPDGFEDDIRKLRSRIPQLSNASMRVEVQRFLARLGDGHTRLQEGTARQIPLSLYDFSDGMFVTDAPSGCECIGDRVVAIGSTPIQTAAQKITPFLSVDNAMGVRLQAPAYLRYTEYLRAAGISSSDEVVLSLEGTRGKRQYTAKTIDDPAYDRGLFPAKLANAGPVPRYMQHRNDNYWFELLPDGKTLYFQFNQVLDESGNPIEKFAVKLRAALGTSTVRNLIVDMRHNGGGNLNLFTPLLRSIITFETTHDRSGLYVITGRRTFSAAQVFINELDRYTKAVFAGEPSSSRPNFIGESARTALPYSGLEMTISTRYHQTDDQDQRTWIAPKIPVELSSLDYFANRDPMLDAVLEVIRAGK